MDEWFEIEVIDDVTYAISEYGHWEKVHSYLLIGKTDAIHTPGHSPGHICLFEEEKGYLYTGDLIYKGTLYAFYPSTDPILFKQSVDKISMLKGVTKILPAHNELNVQVNLIESIKNAFKAIEDKNMLKQGSGIFEFNDFKIIYKGENYEYISTCWAIPDNIQLINSKGEITKSNN